MGAVAALAAAALFGPVSARAGDPPREARECAVCDVDAGAAVFQVLLLKRDDAGVNLPLAEPDGVFTRVSIEALTRAVAPMSTTMRAKMQVSSVVKSESQEQETLYFDGVSRNEGYPEDGSDENNTFAKFTPSARLEMVVMNPALIGKLKPGDTFYVDFTPVPASA